MKRQCSTQVAFKQTLHALLSRLFMFANAEQEMRDLARFFFRRIPSYQLVSEVFVRFATCSRPTYTLCRHV